MDLFTNIPDWRVTQPPGADHYLLWFGKRIMAQGSMQTVRLNRDWTLDGWRR